MYVFLAMEDPDEIALSLEPPPIPNAKDSDHAEIYDLKVMALDGTPHTLSEYRDKVIFLNLWATWCRPCVAELPSIASLQKQMASRNVEFVILTDEEIKKIREFDAKRKLGLPFFIGPDSLTGSYAGDGIPRTYIIKNGKIEFSHMGSAKWDDKTVVELLKSLSIEI